MDSHPGPAQPHLADVGSPVLDNPGWPALTGPLAPLATRFGRAARLFPEVSPFAALADPADVGAWDDLARVLGPRGIAVVTAPEVLPPAGWTVVQEIPGVQLVATSFEPAPDPDAVQLGPADVPEMMDLVARTQPGPFEKRTIELGRYLGIRHGGALVSMAGERLRLPDWTEISAVCTDPRFARQGLATRLVRAVAWEIRRDGRRVFLHTSADNSRAIGLYESIGFTMRRHTTFAVVRSPRTGH